MKHLLHERLHCWHSTTDCNAERTNRKKRFGTNDCWQNFTIRTVRSVQSEDKKITGALVAPAWGCVCSSCANEELLLSNIRFAWARAVWGWPATFKYIQISLAWRELLTISNTLHVWGVQLLRLEWPLLVLCACVYMDYGSIYYIVFESYTQVTGQYSFDTTQVRKMGPYKMRKKGWRDNSICFFFGSSVLEIIFSLGFLYLLEAFEIMSTFL